MSRSLLKTLDKDCHCMRDRLRTFSRMYLSEISRLLKRSDKESLGKMRQCGNDSVIG